MSKKPILSLLAASTRLLEERPRPREDERCQEAEEAAAVGEERDKTEFPINFPHMILFNNNVAIITDYNTIFI